MHESKFTFFAISGENHISEGNYPQMHLMLLYVIFVKYVKYLIFAPKTIWRRSLTMWKEKNSIFQIY